MKIDLRNIDQVDYVIKEMKLSRKHNNPYKSLFPLKKLMGTVKKVHRLGMNTYSRLLYVNPIDGVLGSYTGSNKFPHQPSYVIQLEEIKECGVLLEDKSKWFFKRGHYYFIVRSESKTSYFFHESQEMAEEWTK